MLALERCRGGKRRRLEFGCLGRQRPCQRDHFLIVAINQHAGALRGREQLVELPLVVDELRRAAGAGLEDARVQAEIEAIAPGVDVERRLAAREDLDHALGREKAGLEPRAERRAAPELAPPRAVDAHVDAFAYQALGEALAKR